MAILVRPSATAIPIATRLLAMGSRRFNSSKAKPTLTILDKEYPTDIWTNVPESIIKLTGTNLHKNDHHPIGIIRSVIEKKLQNLGFTFFNDYKPVVSVKENFDDLDFPPDHPGRSKTDTYYVNKDTLLRTHTSAHEAESFRNCKTPGYLISADVYRRDTIDKTHFPAFHQMEGARIYERGPGMIEEMKRDLENVPKSNIIVEDPNPPFSDSNPKQSTMTEEETRLLGELLKRHIELIMGDTFHRAKEAAIAAGSTDPDLFKPIKARWIEAYFPWTSPSWEIEIWWKGEWLEMCGCGVLQEGPLKKATEGDKIGWAFGIGLERAAMILFGIPDIRLFWSKDERFLKQFKPDTVSSFKPFSKYPSTARDVTFWLPDHGKEVVHENDLMEVIRGIAGDLVENVSMIDEFVHPKTGRQSQCYRITYQSMHRSLTNDEVNVLQEQIRNELSSRFQIELR